MKDSFGRNIDYLRISLTDRCNLRCIYCMPSCGIKSIPHDEILRNEEIICAIKIAADLGIKHIRLTGGEPLVRKGLPELIASIKSISGIESIALTTNATLLKKNAKSLKESGLDRINISLDTLDSEQYKYITRRGKLEDALSGIKAAIDYRFDPVKINCVVIKSLNQDLSAFATLTKEHPLHVRFIEYMPVGDTLNLPDCNWGEEEVIKSDEVIEKLQAIGRCSGLGELNYMENPEVQGWGPARYYKFENCVGTIGIISAISNHFCNNCNRLRLTSDGKIKPCLFSDTEFDIKTPLRKGNMLQAKEIFSSALRHKPENHASRQGTNRSMNSVGG